MTRLTILGTDTDAGKTSFALLWLAAFPGEFSYWKPVETGPSDSENVRRLVPRAQIHEPLAHFADPVAPPLAARRAGKSIPTARQISDGAPASPHLLVETFGGPFSPLNDNELQIELIRNLGLLSILVSATKLGTIGRTLAVLEALQKHTIQPAAVVLMGGPDDYAREQIARHFRRTIVALWPPETWNPEGIAASARRQLAELQSIRQALPTSPASSLPRASDWDADRFHIWHPYTSLRDADLPIPIVGAQDEFLHLADGRRVIDGISSWWTILHGHREPRLMAALHEAAETFDHVLFAGATHLPAIRTAELLLQTAPWPSERGPGHGRVFFSDNGSTAVEVALKMAYQFWRHRGEPERTLFIGFEGGYHGDTFGAMAVGRDPLFFGSFEPLLFQTERIPVSAERLDEMLERCRGRVAAVVLEPLVQGAGGMRMHSPEELRRIFEVTRVHHVLFIADEVMTGCHRTGTMWAYQASGIAPDLICAAKMLAGGILPLAATLASPEIVAAFDTADHTRIFFHGHSFTAQPLACAVAARNLELLRDEPPVAPARIESFWRGALAGLQESPRVRDLRIRGSIAAVELDLPGGYLAEAARLMRRRCLELGVFLRPLGNVIYAMPPLGTSPDSLEKIAAAIRSAVGAAG